MTPEKTLTADYLVYKGIGSYDISKEDAVYKIILPASQMGNVTVDSKIYNISKSGEQAILLWLRMTDGNDVDFSKETEIYIHEVSLDLKQANIEAYDSTQSPPAIDLAKEDEIVVKVVHN
ncbi:hypothetical protein VF12_40190, partial [Nostoc linckia z15]